MWSTKSLTVARGQRASISATRRSYSRRRSSGISASAWRQPPRMPNSSRSCASASRFSGGVTLTYESNATVCMTPPFSFSARSCSSSMLRGWSASARVLEWLAITGALETRTACIIAALEMCETSTMMPSRFISATTCSPNSLSPSCSASPSPRFSRGVAESAMSLWPPCASVM